MKNKRLLWTLFLIPFFACQNIQTEPPAEDAPATAVTQWTNKMEIFMEYPIPVQHEPVKFIIHLTTIDDFKPVLEGVVKLDFLHENGKILTVTHDKLLREGIFTPITTFAGIGKYDFTITYTGDRVTDTFNIGEFTVYQHSKDIPADSLAADEGIAYLKEQQWKTEFATEPVAKRKIKSSILASGEILPRQQTFAEIVTPVDGFLNVNANQKMATPGRRVRRSEMLAVLTPPLTVSNSWVEIRLAFEQAKKEYDRALRLKEKNSISEREFDNINRIYQVRKAGYLSAFGKKSAHQSYRFVPESNEFQLIAPFDGIINEVFVSLGQKVSAGDRLFTLIDPAKVWLRMNIFEKDYYKIDKPKEVTVYLTGMDSLVHLSNKKMRLLSKGEILDPEKRTIPLLFEVDNDRGFFKIGQVLQVQLYTSEQKELITIPRSALFLDNAQQVVFVQAGGEMFDKRVVKTGASYQNWVAIPAGLQIGERVVTKGGYFVKLASTSEEIGHGHTH